MSSLVKKTKNRKPEPASLPRGARSRVELLTSDPIEMKHLKSAISLLTHSCNQKNTRKKKIAHCVKKGPVCDTKMHPVDVGIALRSRSPRFITQHIHFAILRRDWETAARLLLFFIKTGVRKQTSFISRVFLVILMNHPSCDSELMFNFFKEITLYETEEEVEKFAVLMHTLREKILHPVPPHLYRFDSKLIDATELTTIELNVPALKQRDST